MSKQIQVWVEGYSCTGNSSKARLLGTFEAETFREACLEYHKVMDEPHFFNESNLSIWACKLFDNEEDARKSFG